MKKLVTFLAAFVMLLAVAVPAHAAEVETGESFTVSSDETVTDDLYVSSGTTSIAGQLEGDLIVSGGQVDITGEVVGDVLVIGGQVNIAGVVGDDVRAAGGSLVLNGEVGSDVVLAGGQVDIQNDAHIFGDLFVFGGQVDVRGSVERDLFAYAGNFVLSGTVNGNAKVNAETISITRDGQIFGDLTYSSKDEISQDTRSHVDGTVQFSQSVARDAALDYSIDLPGKLARQTGMRIYAMIALIILGLVAGSALPHFSERVRAQINQKPAMNLLIGFVVFLLLPTASVILALTIIGLPLGVVVGLLGLIGWMTATIPLALWISDKLFPKMSSKAGKFMLGVVLVEIVFGVVGLIPFIGGIAIWVAKLVGFGALTTALVGKDSAKTKKA